MKGDYQSFKLTLIVTVRDRKRCTAEEVKNAVIELVENFDFGCGEVVDVIETTSNGEPD